MYQLYSVPRPKNGVVSGSELKGHHDKWGLTKLGFSIDDPLVRGWIDNPTTYPSELKGRNVLLMKSADSMATSFPCVPFLYWGFGDRVVLASCRLDLHGFENCPALVKKSWRVSLVRVLHAVCSRIRRRFY